MAVTRTPCRKLDPELGEKPGAGPRDFSGFVGEHDKLTGDHRIDEINAQAARKVAEADSGRTQRGAWRDSGRYRGLFSRATATIPSIMSATAGEASRK